MFELHPMIDNPSSRVACKMSKMITLATAGLNNHFYAATNLLQWIFPCNLSAIVLYILQMGL